MNALYRLHARLLQKHSFAIVCVFGLLLGLILPGAYFAVVSNTNDVTDWLPDKYPETRDLRWYQQYFKAGSDHIVIISWDGCTLTDDRVELYANKLRNCPQIDSVVTGQELVDQISQTLDGIEDPRSEAINRLQGSLIGPDYVHGLKLTDDAQGQAVITAVAVGSAAESAGLHVGQTITRINRTATSNTAEALAVLESTYTAEDADTGQQWLSIYTDGGDIPYRWQWSGTRPGRQTAILATLSADGRDEKKLESALNEIRRIGEQECAIVGPDQRIRLGGPSVDNVAIDQEGKRTLAVVATLSFVVGLGMCWLCFRDIKITFLVFFVSIFSEATSLAIVYYSGVPVNAILLSMPTLIYVLTISGAIHIVNYYRDSVVETGIKDAPHQAIRKGFVPSSLSAVTTAMGMSSLLIADLRPIRLFGGFSALAVVSTLMWLFLLLPAVLQLSPLSARTVRRLKVRAKRPLQIDRMWTRIGRGVVARPTVIFLLFAGILFGVGAGVHKLQSSINLMKLFSDDAPIIHDYVWLESRLGPLVPMEVVVRFDEANFSEDETTGRHGVGIARRLMLVNEIRNALEEMPEVDATMSAVTFVPEIPTGTSGRAVATIRRINKELGKSLGDLESAGWIAQSGDEQLFRISLRLGAFSGIDYGSFVTNVREAVTQNALDDEVKTHLETFAKAGMIDEAGGLDVTYTGVVPIVYKSQSELMNGLRESYLFAFAMIAGMMVLLIWPTAGGLKAFPAAALMMIPNIFPTAMVFGTMAWMNHAVDIGSMMTASIALGVAVDDTVHYLSWFRRGLHRGLTRRDSVYDAYSHCARAMTQTTLVAGFGIAMHVFSTFTPTMMFGVLMIPLLGSALVGDLIMLPAMLVSPFGRIVCRREKKSTAVPLSEDGPTGDELAIVPAPTLAAHRPERRVRMDQRFGT